MQKSVSEKIFEALKSSPKPNMQIKALEKIIGFVNCGMACQPIRKQDNDA